jgi:hypothetical protein
MKLPNEYVLLVQVLTEDPKLRSWFENLDQLPGNIRHAELKKMALKMRKDGEDEELISLVESLHDKVLRAAIADAVKNV